MEKRKLYILIDKTLKPVYGCVQGGHAVAQWMLEHPSSTQWRNEYLIYLSADINKWIRKLDAYGINFTEFREPDLNNRTTALAIFGHDELFKRLKTVTED